MKRVERLVHKSERYESRCCTANCSVTPSLMKEIDDLKDELHCGSRSEIMYQAILNFIDNYHNNNLRESQKTSENIRKAGF